MQNPVTHYGSQDGLGFAAGTNMSKILVAETNGLLPHSCCVCFVPTGSYLIA